MRKNVGIHSNFSRGVYFWGFSRGNIKKESHNPLEAPRNLKNNPQNTISFNSGGKVPTLPLEMTIELTSNLKAFYIEDWVQDKALLSIPNGRYRQRYKIPLTLHRYRQQEFTNDERVLYSLSTNSLTAWNTHFRGHLIVRPSLGLVYIYLPKKSFSTIPEPWRSQSLPPRQKINLTTSNLGIILKWRHMDFSYPPSLSS